VSYVGRRGLHAQRERNINQLAVGTLQANPGVNADALRPYKGFNIIRVTNNDANSRYNAFQLGLERRFTRGFSYSFAYTLAKSSDDGSAQRDVVPIAFDVHNLWGPSTYDRRHSVVITFAYQLPFFSDQSHLTGNCWEGGSSAAFRRWQPATRSALQPAMILRALAPAVVPNSGSSAKCRKSKASTRTTTEMHPTGLIRSKRMARRSSQNLRGYDLVAEGTWHLLRSRIPESQSAYQQRIPVPGNPFHSDTGGSL
jgi:hypothetical protein